MSKRPRGPLDPSEVAKSALAEAVLGDLIARFRQHRDEDTLPRGPRGSVYDLRPRGKGNGVTYHKKGKLTKVEFVEKYGPNAAHFKFVEDVLGRARRAGLIDEDWVADGRVPDPLVPLIYDDADEFACEVVESAKDFFLDAQRFQPVFIEVLCEAADLRPRLSRVSFEYGVPVYAGGGQSGIKGKRRMGERAHWRRVNPKYAIPTVVLQVGDYDGPNGHGEKIYVAHAEDSIAYAGDGYKHKPGAPLDGLLDNLDDLPTLTFFRLALSPEQADSLKILDDDGKAEADAIPVPVLDGWLREAIQGLQDSACRAKYEAEQAEQRERLPETVHAALDSAEEAE